MFDIASVSFSESFSFETGQFMGKALVEKLGTAPDACWLFCGPGEGLADLLKGIVTATGTQKLVGGTGAGAVSSDGFSPHIAVLGGVVSDQVCFEVIWGGHISEDGEAAGRELAQGFSSEVKYIQLFSDGITGNGCALLRGLNSGLPPGIPVVGGTSGDTGDFELSWQFAGDRLLSDAVVAIGFSGDFTVGTGVKSGWSPVGLPKKVTRSSRNILYELNQEPALNVYRRFLGKHASKLPAVGVEYPLGFYDTGGGDEGEEYFVLRAATGVNSQDGSIIFAGDVPDGTMARLTCGDKSSILQATREAVQDAETQLEGRAPAAVFLFSCMARIILLGQRTKEEFLEVNAAFNGNVPIVGFYSYGEFCPLRPKGPSLFHNESVVVSIIGI